ncbi:hypothetical protein G6F32_007990 [Rhizopus arrhizus]|nr:hypothetical protein G6F32_007990 [Rhizopus arrhizus]
MEENQQMIADEQYYYGCDNLPHVASLPEHAIPTPIEPDVNQFEIIQQIPNPENVRWSPQEDALLSDAIMENKLILNRKDKGLEHVMIP